jgi:hypothetical protein
MPFYLAAMTLSGLLFVANTDHVPTLDTRPTCAGATNEISVTRTLARCQQSEHEARSQLDTQWKDFSNADKRDCVAETGIGGFPSYVQILTCLEMARDARTMKSE